ncbi:hypothetical protein [Paracoccus aminovorans]|uniref:hypothetical protein n=1 Tax=Paracoccus aminovorans TaxID=34004 RepID=UPI002B2620D2|nr:hypothetical protein [Paracoccus aminovorans]
MRDETGREVQPGESIAIKAGCRCTVRDFEPIDNDRWPDWLVRGCPLHDVEPDAERNERGA